MILERLGGGFQLQHPGELGRDRIEQLPHAPHRGAGRGVAFRQAARGEQFLDPGHLGGGGGVLLRHEPVGLLIPELLQQQIHGQPALLPRRSQ